MSTCSNGRVHYSRGFFVDMTGICLLFATVESVDLRLGVDSFKRPTEKMEKMGQVRICEKHVQRADEIIKKK